MNKVNRFPDFLIVGAGKSGTSSLHKYLQNHPDIFFPKFKELNYFHTRNHLKKRYILKYWDFLPTTLDEYLSYFDARLPTQQAGESCPSYLYYAEDTIKNILEVHPLREKVKIIIMLREPLSKIWSHYKFVKMNQLDPQDYNLRESLDIESDRMQKNNCLPDLFYFDNTKYYESVKRYINSFDNVKIFLFDEFKNDPQDVLNKIYDFIGVDSFVPKNIAIKYNKSSEVYYPKNLFFEVFQKRLPYASKNEFIRKVSYKLKLLTSNADVFSQDLQRELAIKFKPEIVKLQDLIKKDLSLWLNKYENIIKDEST